MLYIVNKINHKHSFYAFVYDLEYEFTYKNGKVRGYIPKSLEKAILEHFKNEENGYPIK